MDPQTFTVGQFVQLCELKSDGSSLPQFILYEVRVADHVQGRSLFDLMLCAQQKMTMAIGHDENDENLEWRTESLEGMLEMDEFYANSASAKKVMCVATPTRKTGLQTEAPTSCYPA